MSEYSTSGESTSARLRRVEQELAVERGKTAELVAMYGSACNEAARAEQERDLALAELASARAELEQLRALTTGPCPTAVPDLFDETDLWCELRHGHSGDHVNGPTRWRERNPEGEA